MYTWSLPLPLRPATEGKGPKKKKARLKSILVAELHFLSSARRRRVASAATSSKSLRSIFSSSINATSHAELGVPGIAAPLAVFAVWILLAPLVIGIAAPFGVDRG